MNRAAIMRDAHDLYRKRRRMAARFNDPSIALPWGEAQRRAWAMAKRRMAAAAQRAAEVRAFRTAPRSRAGFRTVEYGVAA